MSMTLTQAFEVAINDGINIYVRDVLVKKGFLNLEMADELGKQEIIQLKYKIAQDLAYAWGNMKLQVKFLAHDEAPDPYIPVQS